MKLERMYAKDFGPFRDVDVDFRQIAGLNLVEGWNFDDDSASGAGKTFLMDLVSYVPFGESHRGLKVNEFINDQATKGCLAGHEYRMDNGSKLVIERSRKPEDLFYQIDNGKPQRGTNVAETQKMIEDLLKFDFNTFINSVYFTQNSKMNFISASDTEKRDILTRLLDLADFDLAYEICDEELKGIEKQQEALKSEHSKIQSLRLMCEKDVTDLKFRMNNFDEEVNESVRKKHAQIEIVKSKIKDAQLTIEMLESKKFDPIPFTKSPPDISSFDKQQEDLRNTKFDEVLKMPLRPELSDLDAKENELINKLSLKEKVEERHKKIAKAKHQIEFEFELIDKTFAKLEATGVGQCPACLQDVSEEHLAVEIQKLTAQKDDWNNQIVALNAEEYKLTVALSKFKEIEKELKAAGEEKSARERAYSKSLKEISDKNQKISEQKMEVQFRIAEVEKQKQQALREYAMEEKLYAEKNSQLDIQKADNVNRIKAMQDNIVIYQDQIKDVLSAIRAERSKENPFVASIRSKVDAIAELDIKLEHSMNELSAFDKDHEVLTVLKACYKNVKYYVFESTIDELNVRMVKYLDDLFNEDVKINFKFISGKTNDKLKFETKIVKNGIDKSYESFSDGEKGRAKLATNFALSDIVAMRKSNSLSLMLLDEVFNGLPEECRERVVMLLETLKSEKESILIIDHFKAVGTLIEKTIRVEKRDGISKVVDA